MHQAGAGIGISIGEQALILLDISPSVQRRRRLENFSSLDPVIDDSISEGSAPRSPEAVAAPLAPYAVAARMGRSNYEEHAKAEALMNALRQMRGRNAHPSRVLRGT